VGLPLRMGADATAGDRGTAPVRISGRREPRFLQFLSTIAENFRRDGTIREKYNVVTRSSESHIEAGTIRMWWDSAGPTARFWRCCMLYRRLGSDAWRRSRRGRSHWHHRDTRKFVDPINIPFLSVTESFSAFYLNE